MSKTPESIKFGSRFKVLRKSRGLTQNQAATLIGVHPRHISSIEVGTRTPSFDILVKSAKALRYELHEFFLFDTQQTVENQQLDEIVRKLKDNPNKIPETLKIVEVLI